MNGLAFSRGARAVLGGGRLFVVLVATVVFTTLAGAAFGYWSTTGTGVGSATTGTLNAPTGVTATSAAGSGNVNVGWSAKSGTPAAQGYYVRRTPVGGGTSAFACGTSASSLNTGTSCTDSKVADGSYTYMVTAVYNSWTATSVASGSVTVTNAIGTTTTLASSPNPSVVGQQVTYTATVKPASGSTSPSGSVTFMDGSASINCIGGSRTLAAGSATCSVAYTTAGTHTVTAVYGGDSNFAGSTSSSLTQTVQQPAAVSTTTTLVSSQNPAKSGTQITYSATVSPNSGSGAPTGTVTFTEGGSTIACATGSNQAVTSRVATCEVTYPSTALGAHSITATYSGDGTYAASTSPALRQRIVNENVTGVNFANVTVNGSPASPTCSGVGTNTVTCSISGTANSAGVSADVAFVNQSGAATTYATDATTSVGWNGASKSTAVSGTLEVLANASTSASRSASVSRNGSNPATLTYTFTDAGSTYSATLTLN